MNDLQKEIQDVEDYITLLNGLISSPPLNYFNLYTESIAQYKQRLMVKREIELQYLKYLKELSDKEV